MVHEPADARASSLEPVLFLLRYHQPAVLRVVDGHYPGHRATPPSTRTSLHAILLHLHGLFPDLVVGKYVVAQSESSGTEIYVALARGSSRYTGEIERAYSKDESNRLWTEFERAGETTFGLGRESSFHEAAVMLDAGLPAMLGPMNLYGSDLILNDYVFALGREFGRLELDLEAVHLPAPRRIFATVRKRDPGTSGSHMHR